MLLAQPFDPFNNEQTQHKKLPFLARCRFISQRTKRALCNLKNRAHTTATTRGFPTMMLPDNRFMLTSPPHPPPQPWYGSYGGCYDPYLMMGPPPPPPMHFPLMPHRQSVPYSICVHLTSSCPLESNNHQPQYNNKARQYQHPDNSSATESTLYSSASSLYNDDEKEQIEYDQGDRHGRYVRRSQSSSNINTGPFSLTRSNSDILHDRHQYHQQRRRPHMQHRWSSEDELYYQ
ncbi:hypothetical protein PS15m_005019 [Mucor circinelloides]